MDPHRHRNGGCGSQSHTLLWKQGDELPVDVAKKNKRFLGPKSQIIISLLEVSPVICIGRSIRIMLRAVQDLAGSTPLHGVCACSLSEGEGEGETRAEERIRTLLEKHPDWLRERSRLGDMPLHLAARYGKKISCKALLRLGAPVQAPNNKGDTALKIARDKKHDEVVQILEQAGSITTTRLGDGNAKVEALQEEGEINTVEWYTVPIRGAAAQIVRAKHSLLKITLKSTGEGAQRREFVMEKANDDGNMPKGVFVSHWRKVAQKILEKPIHFISGDQVEDHTAEYCAKYEVENAPETFTMSTLIAIALAMGEYNVGGCNCHHMAQAVFNSCAGEHKRVHDNDIPNWELVTLAQVFGKIGMNGTNLVNSALPGSSVNVPSAGLSQSTSQSVQVASASAFAVCAPLASRVDTRFQLRNNCPDHNHSQAADCVMLSTWIQSPESNSFRNSASFPITITINLVEHSRSFHLKAGDEVEIEELRSAPLQIKITSRPSDTILLEDTLEPEFNYDLISFVKPPQNPIWHPDQDAPRCEICSAQFSASRLGIVNKRRHHCRGCGKVVCDECSNGRADTPFEWQLKCREQRMCNDCVSYFNDFKVRCLCLLVLVAIT